MNGMDELGSLLAAERADALPVSATKQGLSRLLGALATTAAPLPVVTGVPHPGWWLVGKWLGVGFVVGVAGAGVASVVSSPSDGASRNAAAPSSVDAPSTTAAVVAARASVEGNAPRVESNLARPIPVPNALPTTTTSLAAAAAAPPNIEEELRLMARAKQEIDAGRLHLAKVWLGEHAQRFPNGAFSLDREALSILVQCGERPEPELAREFERRHPGSPVVGQLRRQCGGSSSGSFSGSTNEPASPAKRIAD